MLRNLRFKTKCRFFKPDDKLQISQFQICIFFKSVKMLKSLISAKRIQLFDNWNRNFTSSKNF